MIVRCLSLRQVLLVVAVAGVMAPGEAAASPARRLARRGVVVPAPAVVVPPVAVPAPIVVGPVPRARRFVAVPAVPLVVPGPARVTVHEQVRVPVPQPAAAPAAALGAALGAAASAAAAQPARIGPATVPAQPAVPEAIAAPLPAPEGEPTAAESRSGSDVQIPFTPAWHASHPQAWRPAQPADWWRVADLATVTAWLGQPVGTAGAAAAGAGSVSTAGADEIGADGLKSVLVLPAGHDNAAAAAGGDWLPLGIFTVVPQAEGEPAGQPHHYQQLAVDRQGVIRGNFHDAISDTVQPITGSVDRDTLTASWTVGTAGSRFSTPLRAFTGPPRTVSVTAGGTSRQLQLLPVQRLR